ncbi:peptide chain release factor N(5)-glutamine methyltransferase [Corynebacterium sp. SCR221107]|uniref:peptide chain release factor N(5)-glutamine methyltransferase n=1 Tax=Corynebacterium sp. SCR221107 TaxID=3017361 RepID=UPI0022EC60B9|nr:peptide chain release factor N(5)-glutamine methyltransferase [Corynebacterium sp. SCR221107]WBT09791.1 peptide chain release factor N(5)-glutamine methyltransferase [Corynebacterium sp. SCR221107]
MNPLDRTEVTVHQALLEATATLEQAGVDTPAVDARALVAHVLGIEPLEVGLRRRDVLAAPDYDRLVHLVASRRLRHPLQHLIGTAWFGPLELKVGPGVFIPRPETEVLADWAARRLRNARNPKVLDLCTGSGALAGYLAHELPQAQVSAVELSEQAYSYAQLNIGQHVRLVRADAVDPALFYGELFDAVVSNPPYVPETPDLAPEVYFDPHEAVFSGADGMEFIRKLVPQMARLAAPGAIIGIEHDDSTSQQVHHLVAESGYFDDVAVLVDLTGRARFVTATRNARDYEVNKPKDQ